MIENRIRVKVKKKASKYIVLVDKSGYKKEEVTKDEIPVWEKWALVVEEAAPYFHIGENKLREMIHENESADWILWNGNKALIKREQFKQYLAKLNVV